MSLGVYGKPVRAIAFASSLRLSDSSPFLRGAANRLTHYFLHPFRSFTVNSCAKLIIHRRHWRLFTSRAPLGFRRLLPLSLIFIIPVIPLSLFFFLFARFLLVFFFYFERIEFFSLGKKLGEESESWWMLMGFNEWRRRESIGEVERSGSLGEIFESKKEFLFWHEFFKRAFDIAINWD